MATRKKSAPRRRASTAPGTSRKGTRRRVSAKNKSIAGDIKSLGILAGVLASPITGKTIEAVRSKSATPIVSWNGEELKKTAISVGVGVVGGHVAGNILNQVKPVKFAWNKGKKMIRGVF